MDVKVDVALGILVGLPRRTDAAGVWSSATIEVLDSDGDERSGPGCG